MIVSMRMQLVLAELVKLLSDSTHILRSIMTSSQF